MDDAVVREAAKDHATATVAGDFKTAGSYLTPGAQAQAGGVMKAMPGTLSGCEVTVVEQAGGGWRAEIVYSGDGGTATVESTWQEQDGRPMIAELKVL